MYIPLRGGLPDQRPDHSLTDINKARMGLAVLVDHELHRLPRVAL